MFDYDYAYTQYYHTVQKYCIVGTTKGVGMTHDIITCLDFASKQHDSIGWVKNEAQQSVQL